MLATELAQLQGSGFDVFITHIKPGEVDAVMAEVNALGNARRVVALQSGQIFALAD